MPPSCSVSETLDREYLIFRSKLIDLAAALDRIERCEGDPTQDRRFTQLEQAIKLLGTSPSNRAEQMQMLFSLPYDPDWRTSKSN